MIQSSTPSCVPFSFSTNNTGVVPKDKIKGVILERFLQSQYPDSRDRKALSDQEMRGIQSRVVSNLFGKRSYQVVSADRTPNESDIFEWFVHGKHGCKLHRRAVAKSDIQVETFLRKAGVDINFPDKKTGDTPLILASRVHNATLVKTLVDCGATINLVNKHGKDALCEAVDAIDRTPYRDESLFSTLECLVHHFADVDQPLTTGSVKSIADHAVPKTELRTANLFIFSAKNFSVGVLFDLIRGDQADNPDIIRSLASATNFNPNIRGRNRLTALMVASIYGRSGCLKALLELPQIDLEATVVRPVKTFEKNWSAYSFAASYGHGDCANLLVDKGAKKIVPALTEHEQEWLDELSDATANRNAALAFSPLALLHPLMAVGVGFISGRLTAQVRDIEARRPQSRLDTPPQE